MTSLKPLGRKPTGAEVSRSWTLLRLSHEVSTGILDAQTQIADARRDGNPDRRGRPHTRESDLLRSAIVVSAGGIDASMTALVTHCLAKLMASRDAAALAHYKGHVNNLDHGDLKRYLLEPQGAHHLYTAAIAKGSFLGSAELIKRVKGPLGLPNDALADDYIQSMDEFFTARNEIAHRFDQDTSKSPSSIARISRRRSEVVEMLDIANDVAASIIRSAASRMKSVE